ncbi:hypothetical protein BLNAU_15150 [Blattamonas nauphoetae]|uniref:Uncharacterized protein n=1 Tax=Blattamonas nauphoetae TaxID=2049346 RepID=A0ABQ9XDA3_9EUKA|nr:hypothetical protein BLNAU_15150 [Blattamonas nauphoetae]
MRGETERQIQTVRRNIRETKAQSIIAGTVELDEITFDSVDFAHSPFIFDSFKSATFETVTVSNSNLCLFIDALGTGSASEMTIKSCAFTNISKPTSYVNSDSMGLCEWETGLVSLTNCSTSIESTEFTGVAEGVAVQRGGWLSLTSVMMSGNGIWEETVLANNNRVSSSFPSLRHNIRCSDNGLIEIGSLRGGDGIDTPSAWISARDCEVTANEALSRSPFFVPTLSSSSTSKLNAKKTGFEVSIEGTTLIPCSLFLEVFERKKDGKEGKMVRIGLSEDSTVSFNETQIELDLPLSSVSGLDKNVEWFGRLVFGEDERTTSFVIRKNSVDIMWLLPIVISITVVLVILLFIVIICCCGRRKEKDEEEVEDGEMIESEEQSIEDEKDEGLAGKSIGVNSIDPFSSSKSIITTEKKEEPDQSDDLIDLKENSIIAEDWTNMKEDTRGKHPDDEAGEVLIGHDGRKGDEKNEETRRESEGDGNDGKEEMEDVLERPHKEKKVKKKRKKKTTLGEVEEATVATEQTEEQDGLERRDDDGSGEGKKKRKRKKKGVEGENNHSLSVDGQNEVTVNEEEMKQGKEGEGAVGGVGESEVKKKKKKKKKRDDVVEEENMVTEGMAEVEGLGMKGELSTIGIAIVADGGELRKLMPRGESSSTRDK